MKKFLALFLVLAMMLLCCACQSNEETSADASKAESASEAESNSDAAEESKNDDSSAAPSEDSTEEPSEDESEEESEDSSDDVSEAPALQIPDNNGMFVCFGEALASSTTGAYTAKLVGTSPAAQEKNPIMLTGYNSEPVYGSVVYYDNAIEGGFIPTEENDYADFAVVVAEYDQSKFNYVLKAYYAVGENDDKAFLELPADGFILVAHKDNKYSAKLGEIANSDIIVPVGTPTIGFEATIKKTSKAPTIDGKVSKNEYGSAVWKIDADQKYWAYTDFVKDNYYVSGEVYMTYDSTNLYVAVVLNTPYHHCPLASEKAGEMWRYECIQVNVISVAPDSDYMKQNFDWNVNNAATQDNNFYQYGYGISSNEGNELLSCIWAGKDTTTGVPGEYVGVRDDDNQTTVYEFSIPFSAFGSEENPTSTQKGYEFSFGLSVNSTNEESGWRNVIMRNGGGVIGRNDLSKSAKIILG